MKKLRWLKSYQGSKIGEEFNAGAKSAESFVSQGYAEYIKEPIKETTPEEAKYYSDKATIETGKNRDFIEGSDDKETACRMLRVDHRNYERFILEHPSNDVNVNNNTATPILPATPYYIKSWGMYDRDNKILLEQIEPSIYYYDIKGKKGLVQVSKLDKEFDIEGHKFIFRQKSVYDARLFYNVPTLGMIQAYLNGQYKPRPYVEINKDIIKALKLLFDFNGDTDVYTSSLCIGQSWIKPKLNQFFFYGIDSTFGGGKTTLGEIVYFLMRHGFIGGNISSASIPRLTDELDLNIFIDEIDQNMKDDDTMAILRKGQRKGNPYVRCEGRDNRPVAYELAGIHGFSFRSELEDAFMNRALRIHSVKSYDHMLPVINSSKKDILKPLADELFIWYLDNLLEIDFSYVATCSRKKGVFTCFSDMTLSRQGIYDSLTAGLRPEEKDFLKVVFGRDNELTFLCLQVSKALGLDVLENLKTIMINRAKDELSSESYYIEALKEYLFQYSGNILSRSLTDGYHAGCYFYPKSKLYQDFIKYLKDLNVNTIGTKKFASMLRDLGFVEGDTITSQRYRNYPTPCLIFTKEISENIGIKSNCKLPDNNKTFSSRVKRELEDLEQQNGKHIPLDLILNKFPKEDTDKVKQVLEDLRKDGSIFEPKEGVMQLI